MAKNKLFVHKTSNMALDDEQNFKVLVQQAEFELNRGAFHRALAYLDRAIRVKRKIYCAVRALQVGIVRFVN